MPPPQDPHRQYHRRKLQPPKQSLLPTRIPLHPLRRLRQPEDRPQINQQRRHDDGEGELHHAAFTAGRRALSRAVDEVAEEGDEDEEGEDLECQAGEEDVICGGWALPIAFRDADQSCPGNLHDSSDDVAGYEDGDDPLPPAPQAHSLIPQRTDHGRQGRVDSGAEEHGRDDDEEVLHHEVDDAVGVSDRRSGRAEAEDVADDFENGGYEGEGGEGPGAVEGEADGVGEEAEGVEDDT